MLIFLYLFGFVIGITSQKLKYVPALGVGCPPSAYQYNGICYSADYDRTKYDYAESTCRRFKNRGIVAAAKDEDTFHFLQQLSLRMFMTNYWIGIDDREKEGTWKYSDGTTVSGYKKWQPGEPNNHSGKQHCGVIWPLKNFRWDDEDCNKSQFYICQFRGSSCIGENTSKVGSVCYELSSKIATYENAEKDCEAKGGLLAIDNSDEIHEILEKLITERPWYDLDEDAVRTLFSENTFSYTLSWFGLKKVFSYKWLFSDGSDWRQFPIIAPGKDNHFSCAQLEVDVVPASCQSSYNFICQFPAEESVTTLYPSTVFAAAITSGYPITEVKIPITLPNHEAKNISLNGVQLSFIVIGAFILGMLCAMGLIFIYIKKHLFLRRTNGNHHILTYAANMDESGD